MSRVRLGLSFAVLAVASTLAVATSSPECEEPPRPEGLSDAQWEVWQQISRNSLGCTAEWGQVPTDAAYTRWPLMPTADGQEPFEDLPIDLPVHGRSATVRVNAVAFEYLSAYLERVQASPEGPLEQASLPEGSILVKENMPFDMVAPGEPVVLKTAEAPSVLTVAAKLEVDATTPGWQKKGGDWEWLYYGLDSANRSPSKLDAQVAAHTESFCVNCHNPGAHTDFLRGLQRVASRANADLHRQTDASLPPATDMEDPSCEELLISSEMPTDVNIDPVSFKAMSAEEQQRIFDCFSWRSFIALNWAAEDGARGVPDTNVPFERIDSADHRVWETWKATWEVFQPEKPDWKPVLGEGPGDWDSARPMPSACIGLSEESHPVLAMTAKNSTSRDVANETGQAFAGTFGTLYDRNGALVRYQVLFNETEFEDLVPLAATQGLGPAGPLGASLRDGSVEVKASWKELCTATDGSCDLVDSEDRYYSRKVLVYEAFDPAKDGEPSCSLETYGLVGMHIAHKTWWAPQWIWSTFEHVDNAPMAGTEETAEDRFSFYRPEAEAADETRDPARCALIPFLAPEGKADPLCDNAELNRFGTSADPTPAEGPSGLDPKAHPNRITRLAEVGPADLNAQYQDKLRALDSVWSNYFLVDTQWPVNGRAKVEGQDEWPVNRMLCKDQWLSERGLLPQVGDAPSSMVPPADCYTMMPAYLRNTSMESYMTTWITRGEADPHAVSNRSCMGCHASGADFSYIWLDGVEQVVRFEDPAGTDAPR